MRAKRIAHLSSSHEASDVRIFVKQCRSLAAADYEVTLIARGDRDCIKDGVKIKAVKQWARGRLGRKLLNSLDVLRKAWRCRADIYHFHDPELIPIGAWLRLTGAKVIYDVHEDFPKQILSKTWMPAMVRRPIALLIGMMEWLGARFVFARVAAATPSIAQRFPPRKTYLVQNFPILDELVQKGNSVPMRERQPYFIYTGTISAIRGIREMVKAIEGVQTAGARLIIGGVFPEPGLEEQMRALAGWQRVEFRGWLDRSELTLALGEVRGGLVLYQPEPNHVMAQPNKLFEYMSASLPVIASDFPFWRSIIRENGCGLVVDPQDPDAIAAAMNWLLENPEEAEIMGQRGREAVKIKYNWLAEENTLLALYRNLLLPEAKSSKLELS